MNAPSLAAATRATRTAAALALSFVLSVALAGCGANEAGLPDPTDPGPGSGTTTPPTLREQLAAGAELEVAPHTSDVELTARLLSVETIPPPQRLEVLGGTVSLRTLPGAGPGDEALVLESLDVAFGDLVLSADEFPPAGLHLTGIRVVLPAPVTTTPYWSETDAEVVAAPMAAITMEWSVIAENGTIVPLAPQTFADMPVDVRLWLDADGTLSLAIDGAAAGAFWSWAGLVEMSDLTFTLAARSVEAE